MGRTFGGTVPFVAMVVTTVATIGGALGLGVAAYPGRRGRIVAAVAVGAAIVIGDLARRRAVRRLGGVNGDVWGALIELATAAARVTRACAR